MLSALQLVGEHFSPVVRSTVFHVRSFKARQSDDTTGPSVGWFHPFRDFVRWKDSKGCTASDLAIQVLSGIMMHAVVVPRGTFFVLRHLSYR